MQLLYATTNPGKLLEVSKYLAPYHIDLVAPPQVGLTIDVEETGATLEENATLKATAYLTRLPHMLVMADDTGIEIDALGGEPGIHVRRWQDRTTPMSDHAIIDYCLTRLHGVPQPLRGAQFRTVIALGMPGKPVELFDGILRGEIAETASPLKYSGFPFETLFYVPEWDKRLGEIHELSREEKIQQGYLTHRERAVHKALRRIQQLLPTAHGNAP